MQISRIVVPQTFINKRMKRKEMDVAVEIQRQRMLERSGSNDVVYEYAYNKPEREATAEQAVKMAFLALLERQKLKDITDAEARKEILEKGEKALQVFSRTHPHTFELITNFARGAEHFTVFSKLARLRQKVDENGTNEAQATAAANEMLQSQCAKFNDRQ
jgi:hypothetical protein